MCLCAVMCFGFSSTKRKIMLSNSSLRETNQERPVDLSHGLFFLIIIYKSFAQRILLIFISTLYSVFECVCSCVFCFYFWETRSCYVAINWPQTQDSPALASLVLELQACHDHTQLNYIFFET
jgi:hypothetical protein